jgi:hypothetical protein
VSRKTLSTARRGGYRHRAIRIVHGPGRLIESTGMVLPSCSPAGVMSIPTISRDQFSVRAAASLSARATEVFGSSDKAMRWLEAPVPSLGYRTPLSLIGSAAGITEVEDTLSAIEYGIW